MKIVCNIVNIPFECKYLFKVVCKLENGILEHREWILDPDKFEKWPCKKEYEQIKNLLLKNTTLKEEEAKQLVLVLFGFEMMKKSYLQEVERDVDNF